MNKLTEEQKSQVHDARVVLHELKKKHWYKFDPTYGSGERYECRICGKEIIERGPRAEAQRCGWCKGEPTASSAALKAERDAAQTGLHNVTGTMEVWKRRCLKAEAERDAALEQLNLMRERVDLYITERDDARARAEKAEAAVRSLNPGVLWPEITKRRQAELASAQAVIDAALAYVMRAIADPVTAKKMQGSVIRYFDDLRAALAAHLNSYPKEPQE